MPTATNRTPVLVWYPPMETHIVVKRGDEFPKDHAIVKDKTNAYLFEEDQGEGARVYSPSEPVEQATQAPGEKRSYVRKPKDEDKGSGNGPIRSDSV